MAQEKAQTKTIKIIKNNGSSGAVYGLGFVGALIYFLQHAVGFWGIVLGILKSLLWPAFIIYRVLEFFRM